MNAVWVTILLAGAGTYLIRVGFFAAAGRVTTVSAGVERILRMIPPAALAALTIPALIRPEGDLDLFGPRMAAGIVAFVVGFSTRAVVPTLVAGMTAIVILESVL